MNVEEYNATLDDVEDKLVRPILVEENNLRKRKPSPKGLNAKRLQRI